MNKGRTEARSVERFPASSEQVGFPFVQQAAKLQRAIDDPNKSNASFKEFFLLTSHDPRPYDAEALLGDKRGYWGIENGSHQRLDVIALEDKSRVRTLKSARSAFVPFYRTGITLHPDQQMPEDPPVDRTSALLPSSSLSFLPKESAILKRGR